VLPEHATDWDYTDGRRFHVSTKQEPALPRSSIHPRPQKPLNAAVSRTDTLWCCVLKKQNQRRCSWFGINRVLRNVMYHFFFFLMTKKYRLCSSMDQVLREAGLLCAEESTPSVVISCHTTHTHTHTFACTSAQTLKLGTISIATQHYRFDYHRVRAGIAFWTVHLREEAPFTNISSLISSRTNTPEYTLNWSNKITITCFITECGERSYPTFRFSRDPTEHPDASPRLRQVRTRGIFLHCYIS